MKLVYEIYTTVDAYNVDREDGGQALIFEADSGAEMVGDKCMFVRVQSWDDTGEHKALNALVGKTVRISIEVLDD